MVEFRSVVPRVNFDWLGNLPSVYGESRSAGSLQRALEGADLSTPESVERIASAVGRVGTAEGLKLAVALGERATKMREQRTAEQSGRTVREQLAGRTEGESTGPLAITGPAAGTRPYTGGGPASHIATIEKHAEAEGVPAELMKRLAHQESGMRTGLVSNQGAMGPAQLMPDTAKALGVTDPNDLDQAYGAMAKITAKNLAKYGGNWGLAAAAYHAGEGNVDKFLAGQPSGVGPKTKAYVAATTGMPIERWTSKEVDVPLQSALLEARAAGRAYARREAQPTAGESRAAAMMALPRLEKGPLEAVSQMHKGEIEARQKAGELVHKEFLEREKEITKEAAGARKTETTLDMAERLVKDPKTIQGTGAETFARMGGFINAATGVLQGMGIAVPQWDAIKNINDMTQKTEALRGLSNQYTISILGGLSSQISNADRDFISKAGPSIANTQQANEALIAAGRIATKMTRDIARITQEYSKEGGKSRAELEARIEKYKDSVRIFENKDGSPTTLALKLAGAPAAAPPPAAAAPPRATPTDAHIKALRANPSMAPDFDAKFGPGSANRILGGA